jgi:DNA mismatch repair protein MutL
MSKIMVMNEDLVNKIAAGEIIERPASVAKELVENSIDAGATRIVIDLENGGKKLIRITDNGVGMDGEDLQRAFESHTTSKISRIEDLFCIRSKGFRGEALSSVASVSRVRASSCLHGAQSGHYVEILGGKVVASHEKGVGEGTQIEVTRLFYNTPVRSKFLKSDATEMGRISDIVINLALAHPEIYFEVIHNDRKVYTLAPADNFLARIASFFGNELADKLIPGTFNDGYLGVTAFLAPPSETRSNTRSQYIFVNRRFVRGRLIYHSIAQAYADYLEPKRYPVVFLYLEIDPHEVDVNVHPTKIEVRFKNSAQVHSLIYKTIKDTLDSAELSPSLLSGARRGRASVQAGRPERVHGEPGDARQTKRAIYDLFQREKERPSVAERETRERLPAAPAVGGERSAFQVHDSFIIEQTDHGINIIDQHALHERILYEEIRDRLEGGDLASQKLLMPETVSLSASDHQMMLEMKEALSALGIEIEDFGGTSILVRSIPEVLSSHPAGELLEETVLELREEIVPKEAIKAREKLAAILACKAAVKSGSRLSPREVAALLESRDRMSNKYQCPHGRPTTLSFSLEEIEKGFRRK